MPDAEPTAPIERTSDVPYLVQRCRQSDLKKQIVSDSPSPSVVRRLFGSLAFMGDLEGTISLAAKVWPFIYPLLVMVAEKL